MFLRRPARPRNTRASIDPRQHHRDRSRGQSLVEFALVLPILLFLTLIALDFGRIYLGYINMQNMARIAANFAAQNPTAWDLATPNAEDQLKYRNQILQDATAINCTLPQVAGVTVVPAPDFLDVDGNGTATDVGDTGRVQISCSFGVITPMISNVLGGTVQVSAESDFPIFKGMIVAGTAGGPAGTPPNAAFSGNGVISPNSVTGVAPFSVDFRDTSGGSPDGWLWTFPDTTPAFQTTAQDPLIHVFNDPGTYVVTMHATNAYGFSDASMGVTVVSTSTVNFTANQTSGTGPLPVTFDSSSSTPGGTSYAWTFGTGQGSGTGPSPSHTYNSAGTYTVALTITYPSPTGPLTNTKVGFITVNVANCTVPSLNGVRFNDAQAVWSGAPYNFTGTVSKAAGAPSGNFIITAQSLTGGSSVPCTSDVTVNHP
jgi:PKD repeat protein/Flp pilus assembly protein TadG